MLGGVIVVVRLRLNAMALIDRGLIVQRLNRRFVDTGLRVSRILNSGTTKLAMSSDHRACFLIREINIGAGRDVLTIMINGHGCFNFHGRVS
jgi:hypothetical protein